MPLYEIVLCRPDGDEVRVTDQAVAVGETLVIDYTPWTVIAQEPATDVQANARFMAQLAKT
jgi:hypothetical protein